MELLIPIVSTIAFFTAIVIPLFVHIRSRHRERMALIEKGIVNEDVKYLYSHPRISPYSSLKWGLMFLFVGIAIAVAMLWETYTEVTEAIYFALIFIAAGAALIVFYKIALKRLREGEPD